MTYPPGTDPYGRPVPQPQDSPGWGRSGGYQQQPVAAGWAQTGSAQPTYQQSGYPPPVDSQPGWVPPGGYPGGFPPPRRNNTGLIAAIVAGVVVLVVIGVALVIVTNRHANSTSAGPATPSLVPATSSSSHTTTTRTTTAAAPSNHFSYTAYAHDWNFSLGSVHLHADWVAGRDHPSCTDIENDGKLTGLGCRYAAEMVYRAEGGGLMLTQFVMGMTDSAAAATSADRYADADLRMRPGTSVDNFAVGKWEAQAQGDFLVVTVATANAAVPPDTATKYLHYLEADMVGALLFR